MNTIKILNDVSDDAMVGADGWGHYDANASIEKFAEMIKAEVKRQYPAFKVSVINVESLERVDVATDDDFSESEAEIEAHVKQIISDIFGAQDWYIMDSLYTEYFNLGHEAAETEQYNWSEDAWESEESHRDLDDADLEIAADAFGEGFVRYVPAELNAVMTPGEAVEVFGLAEATVRQAINRGQIFARKSGGTWLIRRSDAEKRWGNQER